MSKPKVFIYNAVDEDGASHDQLSAAGVDLKVNPDIWGDSANDTEVVNVEFEPGTVGAMGVANRRFFVTREALAANPDFRIVAKYTVGVDNVDVGAATELGILVTHSPTESNWGAVAEGTMAIMLTLLKRTREKDRHVKNGRWRDPSLVTTFLGRRMQDDYPGITVGIVGLGRIGRRVADLLAPWRVRLLACDPYIDDSVFVHHGCEDVDLETLLTESDVVTLHTNLTEETTNLIGAAQFALMKPEAVLINAARGAIVDVDALFDALDRDRIAAAGLDVLPEEPPDPQLPLIGLGDKVLLSPHMIAYTKGGALGPAIPWATDAILKALRGELPNHVFNEEVIPRWLERFGGKDLLA